MLVAYAKTRKPIRLANGAIMNRPRYYDLLRGPCGFMLYFGGAFLVAWGISSLTF